MRRELTPLRRFALALVLAAALTGCPRAPIVVDTSGPSTPVDAALYWYYEGRSWVRTSHVDGDVARALVWAGDRHLWVEMPHAGLTDAAARLAGARRAVRDRIVWMECLDPRDPGGGTAEAQMARLRKVTGERFDTPRAWYAWWQEHGERLVLGRDGALVVGPPAPTQPPAADAPAAILSLRVARQAPDTLLLAIEYEYDGTDGASLGAITLVDGASTGHWAYKPAPVFRGRHTAYVPVSINAEAPETHRTNEVRAELYVNRRPVADAVFPLEKTWVKAP